MAVNDEMRIGGVGVHANVQREQRAVGVGNEAPKGRAKVVLIPGQGLAVDGVRRRRLAWEVMSNLQTGGFRQHREAVQQPRLSAARIVDGPDG